MKTEEEWLATCPREHNYCATKTFPVATAELVRAIQSDALTKAAEMIRQTYTLDMQPSDVTNNLAAAIESFRDSLNKVEEKK